MVPPQVRTIAELAAAVAVAAVRATKRALRHLDRVYLRAILPKILAHLPDRILGSLVASMA